MAAPTVQVLKLRPPAPLASPPARLTEALLAARPGSVTLLAAAPGYGRTTVASAVAAAAAAADEAVAWVSVDAVDAAPGRLLAHIEAAVAGALSSAPYAGSDGSAVAGDLARWDALLDRWSTAPPSWLMLDDLHRVTDPAALGALSYVVGRLPTTVRLLVTSRRDLPALTADLRTSSLLTVLDEGALSLTDGEVRAQLSAIDRSLGSSDTERLVRLCAGWPAAIAAVAAVVERGGPIPELLPWLLGTETEQLLADWWSRLPPPGQNFLLGTAVLPRLHPEVCDLFLGCSDSHATLFELVADHAFLRPADVGDVRGWARHPLLTELLQHRSGQPRLDADRLRAVAAWAAQHDAVDTEVRTLALAGELDRAIDVVRQHEEPFLQQGRTTEVLAWYSLLPTGAVTERAGLLLRQAWAGMLAGDIDDARALHDLLRSVIERDASARTDLELVGDEALLAAQLALADASPAQVLVDARRASAAFGDAWDRPAHQTVAVLTVRALLWLGRIEQAAALVRDIERRPGGIPLLRQIVLPGLSGSVALAQGRVRKAHALASQALSALDTDVVIGGRIGLLPALLCRGLCSIDLADPDHARADLLEVVRVARADGMLGYEVLGLAGLARLEWTLGDALGSVEVLGRARHTLATRAPTSPLVHHLNGAEALSRITLGDAARAERLISLLPPGPSTTLLTVRLAQLRRPGSGTSRLERLVPIDPRTRTERSFLMASALAAGQSTQATRWLLDASRIADPQGLLTVFVGGAAEVLDLARTEARRSADDSLTRLVEVADRAPTRAHSETHVSAGERELLALLPSRDSNEALAARLGISLNTVKTRLRRLYAKLEVGSRDDAVRVARERGLIG